MNTSDDLATRWVRSAARAAPATLRERLEEEWLADLAARPGWLARMRFGAGCHWATHAIAHDFGGAQLAAVAGGADHALAFHHPHGTSGPRRTVTLFVIVGLHAIALYALTRGIVITLRPEVPPITQVRFVDHHETSQPRLPGPLTGFTQVVVDQPPTPGGLKFSDDLRIPPPSYGELGGMGTDPAPVHRVNGGLGAGFPSAEDFYPPAAKRLGERGVTAVHVCVDPLGRLTSDPTIAGPSGSLRLDEGALKLARAGSGLYRPTTEGGQAVKSCYTFRVRFELQG